MAIAKNLHIKSLVSFKKYFLPLIDHILVPFSEETMIDRIIKEKKMANPQDTAIFSFGSSDKLKI